MAEKQMIYDFETVLSTLLKSQSDLIEIVSKWSEIIDPHPRNVEFMLSGRNAPLVVPNIQMVIDTLNERSLPPQASFNKVTIYGQGGEGSINNGGISFAGEDVHATYSVAGTEGSMWKVTADTSITSWPVPRYWSVESDTQYTITISPAIEPSLIDSMSDFFVEVPPGKSVKIIFRHYGGTQTADTLTLDCPANKTAIWHVAAIARRRPRSGGLECVGRATLMNGGM